MSAPRTYVLLLHDRGDDPEVVGPFESEDACRAFAARISADPNDCQPALVVESDSLLAETGS